MELLRKERHFFFLVQMIFSPEGILLRQVTFFKKKCWVIRYFSLWGNTRSLLGYQALVSANRSVNKKRIEKKAILSLVILFVYAQNSYHCTGERGKTNEKHHWPMSLS